VVRLRYSLWFVAPGGSGASLQRIVDSAIDLADTEGLTAVSMRRIAIELSVATMRCTATCVARTLCAC